MRNLKFLSLLILAIAFAASPALAEETITPTEVERIKDHYYFKIHGGPYTPMLEYGKAEFIYKNLSTETQYIRVCVEQKWHDSYKVVEFPRTLNPGEEWSPTPTPEDFGVTIHFWLFVDGSLAFESNIWVPPPQ